MSDLVLLRRAQMRRIEPLAQETLIGIAQLQEAGDAKSDQPFGRPLRHTPHKKSPGRRV